MGAAPRSIFTQDSLGTNPSHIKRSPEKRGTRVHSLFSGFSVTYRRCRLSENILWMIFIESYAEWLLQLGFNVPMVHSMYQYNWLGALIKNTLYCRWPAPSHARRRSSGGLSTQQTCSQPARWTYHTTVPGVNEWNNWSRANDAAWMPATGMEVSTKLVIARRRFHRTRYGSTTKQAWSEIGLERCRAVLVSTTTTMNHRRRVETTRHSTW